MPVEDREDRGAMARRYRARSVPREHGALWVVARSVLAHITTDAVPYLYLDATFVDARWARGVENVSALVAYGIGVDGHRHLLGVHIGMQESEASWAELLAELVARGLSGVRLVVRDEHAGLATAARKVLPEARQQRCTVHLTRNVVAHEWSRTPARRDQAPHARRRCVPGPRERAAAHHRRRHAGDEHLA
jgi:putative transposase